MKKKIKITFLVDNYFPKFSPVAKCAYNIADELSNDYEVSVITLDGRKMGLEIEDHRNQRIVRSTTSGLMYRSIIETKILDERRYRIILFLIRLKGYLMATFSRVNIDKKKVESYYTVLESIKPEVLIPICLPFESVIASITYKKQYKNVVLIPFLFDRFTYNKSLQRNMLNLTIKKRKHIKLEKEMEYYSNHIFAMHQLRENFEKVLLGKNDNITYIEHPLLKELNIPERTINDENIRLIYGGALYKNYRTPEYLLKVFSYIKGEFLLKFFSSGNCEDLIAEYAQKDIRISRNGYVEVDVLEQEYSNADILISIGNFKSQNLASKIFEYMSLGKPIIHFYVNDKDPVLNLLNKYPLALLIDQKVQNVQSDAEKIKKFCIDSRNSQVGFDIVKDNFLDATPEFISKEFIDIIMTSFK